MTTRVVFSVVDLDRNEGWSATFKFRKVLTVESTRCLGYFSLEKTDFRLPRDLNITPGDLLVSYDVSSLFTNVPLDETITILADRAFRNNWFNSEYDLNISKQDLIDLLGVATKGQLFQFNRSLYEQVDGVAMGSPLGPLLANVFMSSIEEKLDVDGKLPPYYRRYVDDTFTVMPDLPTARDFLTPSTTLTPPSTLLWRSKMMECFPFSVLNS